MKVFKMIVFIAVLAVFVLAAYSWYLFHQFNDELNKKRTEAARAARWKKDTENENEKKNDNEKVS